MTARTANIKDGYHSRCDNKRVGTYSQATRVASARYKGIVRAREALALDSSTCPLSAPKISGKPDQAKIYDPTGWIMQRDADETRRAAWGIMMAALCRFTRSGMRGRLPPAETDKANPRSAGCLTSSILRPVTANISSSTVSFQATTGKSVLAFEDRNTSYMTKTEVLLRSTSRNRRQSRHSPCSGMTLKAVPSMAAEASSGCLSLCGSAVREGKCLNVNKYGFCLFSLVANRPDFDISVSNRWVVTLGLIALLQRRSGHPPPNSPEQLPEI